MLYVTNVNSEAEQAVSCVPTLNRAERRKAAQSKSGGADAARNRLTKMAHKAVTQRASEQARAVKRAMRSNDRPFSHPKNQHRLGLVFDPLFHFLDQLETTGEVDAMPDGTPLIYLDAEKAHLPIVPAFLGMFEVFEKLGDKFGWGAGGEGVRQLAKALEYMRPITSGDVASCRTSLQWMRSHIESITPADFSSEAIEVQVAVEAESLGLCSQTSS